jgi:PAS domain S-box-containing protein
LFRRPLGREARAGRGRLLCGVFLSGVLALWVASGPRAAEARAAEDGPAEERVPARGALEWTIQALGEGWRWRLFDRGHGLASSRVSALHQDRDLHIYAATDRGLSRYDLWEWTAVENAEPFDQGQVRRFVESLGVLYAATPEALWKVQSGSILQLAHRGSGIHLTENRGEAYGIDEGGAPRHFRLRGDSIQPFDGAAGELAFPPGRVLDYELDSNRNHWLATSAALFMRLRERRTWKEVEERQLDDRLQGLRCVRLFNVKEAAGGAGRLWALFQDPDGAARGGQLARLDDGVWLACEAREDVSFEEIVCDEGGTCYATADDGRLLVSADGCEWALVEDLGLGKIALHGGLVDSAGWLWFRAGAGGVAAFDPTSRRWERIPSGGGETFPNVLSLAETGDGALWMGLDSRVVRYHPEEGVRVEERVEGVQLRRVTGLAEDTRGRVWVSSPEFNGAFYFDGAEKGSESVSGLSDHPVRRIVRDRRGDLWFLSEERLAGLAGKGEPDRYFLYRLSLSTAYAFSALSLDRGPVNDLLVTESDVYWIATDDGLVRAALLDAEGRFRVDKVFTEEDGMRSRRALSVAEGPDGATWVSDPDAGVSRVSGSAVRHYGVEDGLPSSGVWSISLVGQSLWFGTERGLCRFDGECWYGFPVASASPHASRVSLVAPARRERDAVLVGTFGQGAFWYRPEERGRPRFTRRDFPTRPGPDGTWVCRWDGRDFRDETPPELLLSRHRTDGGEWSPFSTLRSCELSGLTAGPHTFEVELRDLDGHRNRDQHAEGRVHHFVVDAGLGPSGGRPWLLAALVLVAGGLGAVLLSRRTVRRFGESRRAAGSRSFYEAFPSPVFVVDASGRVLDYNGSAPEVVGLEGASREDLIGRPLSLLAFFSSEDLRARLRGALAGEPFLLEDHRWVAPQQDERWSTLRGFPTRAPGGAVTGAVVVVEDTTRRRAEGKLLEREGRLASLRSLARRVAPATGDAEPVPRLEELARRLAAFARDGSLEGAPAAPVLAGDLLARLIEDSWNGGAARGGKVRIDLKSQTGLWPVRVGAAFGDVLREVLSNACDAAPDGGVVAVRASNLRLDDDQGVLRSGSYVEIEVEDEGAGIEPSRLEQIFEPFYSTKPRDRALGVGLSLAWSFVRGHGGDLRVESQPGKGTRVRILIPAARGA